MEVNFGGFVPLSTVDWRGRAVCTVFLRGCPVRCHYCHNRALQTGKDMRDTDEVVSLIKDSRIAISGVVFSGGEATAQKDALLDMAKKAKKMGLKVGVQTNGVYPETIKALIDENAVDLIHLDIKTRWEHYQKLLKVGPDMVGDIRKSLAICRDAYTFGRLPELQIVCTMFRGREDDLGYIAKEAEGLPLVLQQGVFGKIQPLSFDELKAAADRINRSVLIRTREDGEVVYDRNRITIADTMVVNDISQARRNY